MVTVWGRQSSSNVQAVLWCLAELKIPFNRIDAGLHYGITDTPEYLAMNPNGTVPTLQDADDPPLWESAAILRYLAGRNAPDTFWPADPVARADVDRWAEWAYLERCYDLLLRQSGSRRHVMISYKELANTL